MAKLLKWIFYLIAAAAAIVVGGSFLLPGEAVVTRSVDIAAPPDKVFAIIGDYRRFREFSPWADYDPDMTVTFEGPQSGVGQKMVWTSAKAGNGSQTIVEYDPPNHLTSDLNFEGMGRSLATWDLVATTAGTHATWGFRSGLHGIAQRWFGLMFDHWIGGDYEKGLARLKAAAEKA